MFCCYLFCLLVSTFRLFALPRCTYCLIYSVIYASDPIWGPGPGTERTEGEAGEASESDVASIQMDPVEDGVESQKPGFDKRDTSTTTFPRNCQNLTLECAVM